jgi:preprotein translocase subunit SecG
LVIAWVSLIGGIFCTVIITAFIPAGFMAGMSTAGGASGAMPSRGFVAVVLTFIIVCLALLFVVVPLAFVLFYRRKDVEETCKRRDPVERWTDRTPLPVLAVSQIFLVGGLYYLLIGFTTPLLPVFGRYVTGIPAAMGIFCVAAVDIVLAFWYFRLKPAAWWAAMIFLVLRGVSGVITMARGNLLEAYSKLGWSQEQLQLMNANPAFRSGMMLWASLVFTVVFLGFVIWTKRYFKVSGSGPVPELPAGGSVSS